MATQLEHAIYNNNLQQVRRLISEKKDIANSKHGETPALVYAVSLGNLEIVRELLRAGARAINEALVTASFYGNNEIVRELLQQPGIDVNFQKKRLYIVPLGYLPDGPTALINAARSNFLDRDDKYLDIVVMLLEAGARLDLVDENNKTAFQHATNFSHFGPDRFNADIIELLYRPKHDRMPRNLPEEVKTILRNRLLLDSRKRLIMERIKTQIGATTHDPSVVPAQVIQARNKKQKQQRRTKFLSQQLPMFPREQEVAHASRHQQLRQAVAQYATKTGKYDVVHQLFDLLGGSLPGSSDYIAHKQQQLRRLEQQSQQKRSSQMPPNWIQLRPIQKRSPRNPTDS